MKVLTALKNKMNYFSRANVVLEIHCLPLFGMISNYSTPNIVILRSIAYIQMLNLDIKSGIEAHHQQR